MPDTITVEEAQANLKELINKLAPGGELVITDNQQPVAKLIGAGSTGKSRPAPGLGKGSIVYMAPDFDEAMDEFDEYVWSRVIQT
jgi:prevent-host-death family protein